MMKFAVIGCGNIAKKSVIPALIKAKNAELVVCIDWKSSKEKEIRDLYNCGFATSIKEAVEGYDFDAVYISTPVEIHKKYILEAANFKKHVLCEKSIVSNYDDAIEVIETCKKNGVALFEGLMYQFHPQHELIKKLINDGEIGTPFHVQAWFGFPPINNSDFRYKKSLGGGCVLDAGAYTIHFSRKFFNCEPLKLFSIIENENNEVDIRGTVMMDFGDSRTAHCVFGFNNHYQNNYIIWGTKGKLSLTRAFALPPDFSSTLTIEKQGKDTINIQMPTGDHFEIQFNYFVKNAIDQSFRNNWYEEIKSQASVLSQILNPEFTK